MSKGRKFVDIDLSFRRHPVTGDIGIKTDVEAIKSSIRNLIKTAPYDRKFHPEIACRIKKILFMDVSSLTIRALKDMVTEVLDNYEPRITVEKIIVSTDESLTQYNVIVYFRVRNVPEPMSVTTLLRRIR